MKITDIKIRKILEGKKLKAIVSITLNDLLAVHDLKVIQTDERYFVAMPNMKFERNGDNTYKDIVHPINSVLRKEIEEAVLNEYKKHLKYEFGIIN